MSRDWFRKTTWTKADSEDFFAHLGRSRKTSRGQYLRIQSLHLHETGDPFLSEVALSLIAIFFNEYPEPGQMASAYDSKAECLLNLNQVDEALICLMQSIDFQRDFPNCKTMAAIRFGWVVVDHKRHDLYNEVLKTFEDVDEALLVFPKSRYDVCAIQAFIFHERKDGQRAKEFAQQAIAASEATHSGMRNHPKLGLVEDTDTTTHKRLKRIAASRPWERLKQLIRN